MKTEVFPRLYKEGYHEPMRTMVRVVSNLVNCANI